MCSVGVAGAVQREAAAMMPVISATTASTTATSTHHENWERTLVRWNAGVGACLGAVIGT
jgi:hypothetical protein